MVDSRRKFALLCGGCFYFFSPVLLSVSRDCDLVVNRYSIRTVRLW